MKILSEKDQLLNKLDELDKAIKVAKEQRYKATERKKSKENFGIFSFITDEYWLLDLKQREAETLHSLLLEYRDVINDRLLK